MKKKKDEDKNLIQSKTQIRIKNVMKSNVQNNTSSKKPVGKLKSNLSKITSPKKQVSKDPKSTSPKNQVEKMKLKDSQSTSPKKHVETVLENNIVIPQQKITSLKTNEMFDEFIKFKQEFMSNPENQKKHSHVKK